jgi:hypothetical protein
MTKEEILDKLLHGQYAKEEIDDYVARLRILSEAMEQYRNEGCQKRDELIKLMYQMLVDYSNKKYKHSDIWLKEWNKVEQLKKELK